MMTTLQVKRRILYSSPHDLLWGLEYRRPGLACGFSGFRFGSCCDLILAGEPVEDRSAVQLVAGQVDHAWGTGFGLGRCELGEGPVWSRCIEVVQVNLEDPA